MQLSIDRCPPTNSPKSDFECMQCSDITTYEDGLSFSFDSSHVTFEQHNKNLVQIPIGHDNSFGNKISLSARAGTSLTSLGLPLDVVPPSNEAFPSGFGSKAAMFSGKHLVVSAPGDDNSASAGAIFFYIWDNERWSYNGRKDGITNGQHLGSKELKFLSDSIVEVVSEGHFFTYYANHLVSKTVPCF